MIRRRALAAILALTTLHGLTGRAQPPAAVAAKLTAGVWAYVGEDGEVVVSGSFLGVPPDSVLLPGAVAVRQAFDFRKGDPVLGCGPPGMPRALTAGSPMTFAWTGRDLKINYESMDVERVIHMNGERPGANIARSPNGFSVGRWDGDALVVTTTLLDERVVDMLGTPKSDAMTVQEHYRIDEAGSDTYLRVELTMTDPQTFVAPYLWHFDFVLRRDWALMEYACVERPVELTPGVVAN
jgi:hypothetical protein